MTIFGRPPSHVEGSLALCRSLTLSFLLLSCVGHLVSSLSCVLRCERDSVRKASETSNRESSAATALRKGVVLTTTSSPTTDGMREASQVVFRFQEQTDRLKDFLIKERAPDSGAEEVKLPCRKEPSRLWIKLVPSSTSRVHFSASPDSGSSSCLKVGWPKR